MTLTTLRISSLADDRIAQLYQFYQDELGEDRAREFVSTIFAKFSFLEKFNKAGPIVPGRDGVRRLVILRKFRYYVFYRLTVSELVILHVSKDADAVLD